MWVGANWNGRAKKSAGNTQHDIFILEKIGKGAKMKGKERKVEIKEMQIKRKLTREKKNKRSLQREKKIKKNDSR